MREKLIELICSTEYGNGSLIGNNFQKGFIEKIADHLIANGVTLDNQVSSSKWIPVSERLPETNGYHVWVIACVDGNRSCVRMFERKRVRGKLVERFKYPWEVISNENVTHWMPLPEPPKEG